MSITKHFFSWLTGQQFIKYMDGGGGGGGQPTESKVYQTSIPDYARPYVETMLGTAQQEIFDYAPSTPQYEDVPIYTTQYGMGGPKQVQTGTERRLVPGSGDMVPTKMKAYKPFNEDPSEYFAPATKLQTDARDAARNMGVAAETGQAADMARQAGMAGFNANYQAGQFGNQFQAPGQYQPGQFSMGEAQAPSLQNYQFQNAPQDVQSQQFDQGAAQQYMNPYMQSVVDLQQQDAQRQADIATTGRNAQAVGAGAFGGSRQAIMDAEAAKNLAAQKGSIQAQGLQSAYGQAQQQFNADQAQRMQAALANQGMGYNVGSQNLAANLGIQQLGSGQNLQAQLANQQALMQAQNAAEQSRQFGAGQGMTAAQQRAQYGLAGQQAGEQSRQFGAGIGMQGIQNALNAAGQLGQFGQNIYGQQVGNINLRNQMGAQQQQEQQAIKNQQIQNFATAAQYPMLQLGNMSNLLRGLPMQSTSVQSYQAAPSPISQLGGLGLTAAGIAGMSGIGKAKGGRIKEKKRPAGLAELALSRMV